MGGKSRKSGGVSRKLIQQLKANQAAATSESSKKVKKFLTNDEEDEKTSHKGLFGKSQKRRC